MTSRLPSFALLSALGIGASTQAGPLPTEGQFNLRCAILIRTVSGPPLPANITANYAVDLKSKTWCVVDDDHCATRYGLRQIGASVVEFTIKDALADSEKFLVNLETGTLAGHANDAPNGLINGFRTYLAEGECVSLPYADGRQP